MVNRVLLDQQFATPRFTKYQLYIHNLLGSVAILSLMLMGSTKSLQASVPEPVYGPLTSYPLGNAISVASGDVDNDGDIDLVAIAVWSNALVIYYNDGAGSFTPSSTIATAQGPYQVALKDLNGDSWLDIGVANQNQVGSSFVDGGRVSIFLNQGGGLFNSHQEYGNGAANRSIDFADFDGDGDFDLATSTYSPPAVSVMFNQGDGTFAGETSYTVSWGSYVDTADLNGDHRPDLIVTNGPFGTATVFRNIGNGSFASGQDYAIAAPGEADPSVHTSDFADLDQDGDLDWVIAGYGPHKMYVMRNRGDGTFTKHMTCGMHRPQFVYLRDFNSDGVLDISAVNHDGNTNDAVSILLGLADGTYSFPIAVPMESGTMEPTFADLNLDSKVDIATANYEGNSVTVRLFDQLGAPIEQIGSNCTLEPEPEPVWSGFFPPIANPPALNSAKAGSAIPIKFSLEGNFGLAIFAAGYPASQVINCNTYVASGPLTPTETPGNSGLTYDSTQDQYSYVWKSAKAWAGACRQVIVRLNNGSEHVAYFKFK